MSEIYKIMIKDTIANDNPSYTSDSFKGALKKWVKSIGSVGDYGEEFLDYGIRLTVERVLDGVTRDFEITPYYAFKIREMKPSSFYELQLKSI